MAPLIYVAATIPLFTGSAVFLFFNIFMRPEDGLAAEILYSVGIWAVLGYLLVGMFVRSIRGTYGDAVADVILSSSALMLVTGYALVNGWVWIVVVIWALLLSAHIWKLRRTQRLLRLTPAELWSPDSLSKRFVPGRPAPGGFTL